jgi:hypothetical protein
MALGTPVTAPTWWTFSNLKPGITEVRCKKEPTPYIVLANGSLYRLSQVPMFYQFGNAYNGGVDRQPGSKDCATMTATHKYKVIYLDFNPVVRFTK